LLRSIPHNPITPDPGSTKNEWPYLLLHVLRQQHDIN
jgi:hypothetical protein